jgi:biopolymer transport protein ExbD
MRFPRNVRIFRGQLDPAPYAGVFFLLAILMLLSSSLVFTPGVPIALPEAASLPGTHNPAVTVAIDEGGQLYFRDQVTTQQELTGKLSEMVAQTKEPVTLIIQADKNVKNDAVLQLALLARSLGVKEALLATRPPPIPTAVPSKL